MTTQELRKMVIKFTEEELKNEIWLPIKNFENYYEISNLGRFKSKDRLITRSNGVQQYNKSKLLKNNYYSNGYVQLTFYVDKVRYDFIGHRVVAEHFIPNPTNLLIVNHINSIRWDNRITNIEWCTLIQNMQHMIKSGRQVKAQVKGEAHPNTNLTEKEVLYIRSNYVKGKFNKKVFSEFSNKIVKSTFDKICHKESWKHL